MKNKRSKNSQLKSYITYDELEQLGLGSFLKKNAGIIGTVVGGALGSVIAPEVGTKIGASIGGSIGGAVQSNEADKEAVEAQNLMVKQQNAQAQAQAELQRQQNSSPMKTFTPIMENGGEIDKDPDSVEENNTSSSENVSNTSNLENENNTPEPTNNIRKLSFEELYSLLQEKGYKDLEKKTAENVTLHYIKDNLTGRIVAFRLRNGEKEEALKVGARLFDVRKRLGSEDSYIEYLGKKTFDNIDYITYKEKDPRYTNSYRTVKIPDFNKIYNTPKTNVLNKLAFNNTFVENYRQNFPEISSLIDDLIGKLDEYSYSNNQKLKILTTFIDNMFVRGIDNYFNETDKDTIISLFNDSTLSKNQLINLIKPYNLSEEEVINYLKNPYIKGTTEGNLQDDDIYELGVRAYAQSALMRNKVGNDFFVILDPVYSDTFYESILDSRNNYPISGISYYNTNIPDEDGNFTYNAGIYTEIFNPSMRGKSLANKTRYERINSKIGNFILANSKDFVPKNSVINGSDGSTRNSINRNLYNKLSEFMHNEFNNTINKISDGTLDTSLRSTTVMSPEEYINNNKVKEFGGVINYEGQTHDGPDGGIPVDEMGNPAVVSNNKPAALVEKGEVAFTSPNIGTYIFSNKLKYNSKETFADKAKQIQRKYKLRIKDGKIIDSISEVAYNKEMLNLMKEQELYRELSGINKEERIKEQFKNIGMPIENNVLPIGENGIHIKPVKRKPFNVYSKNIKKNTLPLNNIIPSFDTGGIGNTTIGLGEALLPSIASTIGNAFLINAMKKRKIEKITPPVIQAPKVDYSNFRNTMVENALASEAQLRRNALLTGASGAQTLQTLNTSSNEINRHLNENLYKSHAAEQELNAKNQLQASIANAKAKLEADALNLENKLARDGAIDTLRSAIANSWAQGFSEYLKGRREFSVLNMQTENYKLEPDKNQNLFEKIFFPRLKKTVV